MAKQVYWDLDTKESIVRGTSTASAERRQYWDDKKKDGCELCGNVNRVAFYHKDPSTFKFYPHYAPLTMSIDEIEEELKKCVGICTSCRNKILGGKQVTARVKDKKLFEELRIAWKDKMRIYETKPTKKEQKKLSSKKSQPWYPRRGV